MEQLNNNAALAMFQAVVQTQAQTAKTDKSDSDSSFQKLMDKAASSRSDRQVEEQPKTQAAAKKTEKEPVQKDEDVLTRVKKLLEQGYVVIQPNIGCCDMETGQFYEAGEYLSIWKGEYTAIIPITDLDEGQMQQLQQMLDGAGQVIDVSDPEADAMLEATAPGADNSPAKLLEQLVPGVEVPVETVVQTEQTVETTAVVERDLSEAVVKSVEEPQAEDEDGVKVEITGAEQAPQRIFHDVKAAPVKVGEVYDAPKAEESNVARQVDAGLAQALERGDSMVRIQLTPENLGSVTVEITRSAEGMIRVALSAHSSETRGLLERHAGELQGMIANRTQQSVEVEVQRQQESQQSQQQNYDGHNGHAQDGQQRRQHRHEQANSQDFIQQLRLGLIPMDGDGV